MTLLCVLAGIGAYMLVGFLLTVPIAVFFDDGSHHGTSHYSTLFLLFMLMPFFWPAALSALVIVWLGRKLGF